VDSAPADGELPPMSSHAPAEQPAAPPRNPKIIPAPAPPPVRPSPPTPAYRAAPPARELSTEPARPVDTPHRPAAPPLAGPMPAPRPAAREVPTGLAQREAPPAAKPAPRRIAQEPPWRETEREILETTTDSTSFPIEDAPPAKASGNVDFAIPQPVRAWLRADRVRPAPDATRRPPAPPAAAPQSAPQSVIDVTVGKVEVTIESDPHPPLVAARRPAPRVAPPARPAPPPATGRLARQYLDR
jgi:hypothetical protein